MDQMNYVQKGDCYSISKGSFLHSTVYLCKCNFPHGCLFGGWLVSPWVGLSVGNSYPKRLTCLYLLIKGLAFFYIQRPYDPMNYPFDCI